MIAIIATLVQIFLLLIRAYLSRDSDHEIALNHLREAQEKLAKLASDVELKFRYSEVDPRKMDDFQELIDRNENKKG